MVVIRTVLLLLVAALLEVGGDAAIRSGLKGRGALPIVAGGLMLVAYGLFVNLSPGTFGRLLGVYVAIFFVLAQAVDAVAFGTRPPPLVIVGGVLVVLGGALVAASRP